MKATLKEIKKGEFFRLKDFDENANYEGDTKFENSVWIKGEYDRGSKTYSCTKFSDVCHEHFFKGSKEVYIGFTF